MECNIANLKDAMQKSKDDLLMFPLDYTNFLKKQNIIYDLLGNKGFIMFTDNRAILCMQKAPNLRIVIKKDSIYCKKDFESLSLKDIEIIGSDINKSFKFWKQYLKDLRDNCRWIIIITLVFFAIFHFGSLRTKEIVSLGENLLNVMGIFISMVFVFIGFIYSDSDKVMKLNLKGIGDKYYVINKYVMNLSIVVILLLIFMISFGNIAKCDLPEWLEIIQGRIKCIDILISYQTQYAICQLTTWISICSMIICFRSLIDYYFRDLKFNFFIASIDKKAGEWSEH